MNRWIPRWIVLALTAWVLPAAAQYETLPEESLFRTEERRYGHLEYFGFYASAMAHWNFTGELVSWCHFVRRARDLPCPRCGGGTGRI